MSQVFYHSSFKCIEKKMKSENIIGKIFITARETRLSLKKIITVYKGIKEYEDKEKRKNKE